MQRRNLMNDRNAMVEIDAFRFPRLDRHILDVDMEGGRGTW